MKILPQNQQNFLCRFSVWRIGVGSQSRRMHRTFTTTRAVIHPDYVEDLQNSIRLNDVAIIFLLQPIERSSNIFPILISPFVQHNITNTQGMVLGFAGSTTTGNEGQDELQAAHVRILSEVECLQAYPNGTDQAIFCANDRQRRSNFCLGDQVIWPYSFIFIPSHSSRLLIYTDMTNDN